MDQHIETMPSDTATNNEDERLAQMKAVVDALTDSTRGRIFVLLEFQGEMTASQLASEIGLTASTVLHHLRILRHSGIVMEPRVEVQKNYLEKYYQVDSQLKQHFRRDPYSFDEVLKQLPEQQQQQVLVTLISAAASILEQQARYLGSLSPKRFREVTGEGKLLASIVKIPQKNSQTALGDLRSLIGSRFFSSDADDDDHSEQLEIEDGSIFVIAGFPSRLL